MPELPEVESLRLSLEPVLLGRTVARATIHRRDMLILPGDPPGGFSRSRSSAAPKRASPSHILQGAQVTALRRRGKQLAILAHDGRGLIIHLGMTGQVLTSPPTQPTHTHLSWTLDDGAILVFRDPRRFGHVRFLPRFDGWPDLGPDALDATPGMLASDSRRAIKAVLLDQAVLGGVGNIYADESLFRAGISPRRRADRLNPAERSRLAQAIRQVLTEAITARGSTLRDYRDASGQPGTAQLLHRVYGRAGKPCLTCGKPLSCATIAQRTTVYCSRCQSGARTAQPTSYPQPMSPRVVGSQSRVSRSGSDEPGML